MVKALNQVIEATKGMSIDWSSYPLPLLPREKVFAKAKDIEENSSKKLKRLERFKKDNEGSLLNNISIDKGQSKNIIVGRCTDLEKPYFRLGGVPDPNKVRPESVLKKSLKMLKNKWKNREGEYRYFEEQFKSIRQDLTVQHIKNKLCVKVYETHARIALESADLDHFNQCQTNLAELYSEGIKGHENEFLSYHLMYYVFNDMKFEIGTCLARLTDSQKENKDIKYALK